MKKIILTAVILVIIVVVFYPKDAGGPLCGPICPPTGLKRYERDCLGIKIRKNVIDGFRDYCYGIPLGQTSCYGDEQASPLKRQEIPMACPKAIR